MNAIKKHKMHSISSYIGNFPYSIANFIINKYSNPNDIVLDTFVGRGTTLLECRLNNRKGYGLDLNPLAYVISKSKCKSFIKSDVISRIDLWKKKFDKAIIKNDWDKKLEIYYSKHNLKQLTFIRSVYGTKWKELDDIDNFILAITLGIMHGPFNKDGSSTYLSLSMSNHTSMSFNYIKKYAIKKQLVKPLDDVFKKIKDRVNKVLDKSEFILNESIIRFGNALETSKIFSDIKPDLIFTSPPYLNLINYSKNNWIKLWLLGIDFKNNKLDDYHKYDAYKEFIKSYLVNLKPLLKENTNLVLVIGDAKINKQIYSFIDLWNEIKSEIKYLTLVDYFESYINQNKKATNSLGNRKGKSTNVDKIYVFKRKEN